jgi:hypothetical protein
LATAIVNGRLMVSEGLATAATSGSSVQPKPPGPGPKPPGPGPGPKPAPKVAQLEVTVKDLNGKPVADAKVTAGALGSKQTDANGVADFGVVTPGTYDITAEKPGHGTKRNGPVAKDEKKKVSVPDGSKTKVELTQHPECSNVAFFEGSTTRSKYFGFDHKTDLVAHVNQDEYWIPVPDKGTLTAPGNKLTRDGARWVSVAVNQETEVEINFGFKGPECIPCIANTTFEVAPAATAEVVTKKVTAKKAVFKIKGKAVGEATLKVRCDGHDIGWFHIWCVNEATIKIDVGNIVTARAPATTYNIGALKAHFADIYRQACLKVDMIDLGAIDLTGNAALATTEATGYSASQFLDKSGSPSAYSNTGTVLNALHAAADASLNARTAAPLPRAGAYRLYWYVPTVGCSILGTVLNIGSHISFGFAADSTTARNSCAHEFGHSLNLRHPSDPNSTAQYAAHIMATLGNAVPAFAATNTEPASAADTGSSNVLANDPTNLMGYWHDRPNRKPLRYHQWKAASRS